MSNSIDFSKYKEEFFNKVGENCSKLVEWDGGNYPGNSIFPSEALAVYTLAKHFEIDLFIESGIFRGASTFLWSELFSDIDIICMDILESPKHQQIVGDVINRFSDKDNMDFIIGDSVQEIPKIIEKYSDKRIGIFVDGPKDWMGLDLCVNSIKNKNVCFTSLHDYTHPYYFSTQTNVEFRKIVGNMNEKHPQIQEYPNGPGLTVIVGGDDE
tara:strand:- start:288 stop:923 length:636 start_codon:yes stop_codon:yes gene_type:complete